MGLPSGVLWAPCNIDVSRPNGFANSPFQYDCSFFSWGNIDGHNPTGPSSFSPWDWGGVNTQDPWYEGQVYGSTPGGALETDIPVSPEFDAARANLGAPWRMPSSDDFAELFGNCVFINPDGSVIDPSTVDKRVTVEGVVGIYLQSIINGARLFFPCAGYGSGTTLNYRGGHGHYWASTWDSARYAKALYYLGGGVLPQYNSNRYSGFTIRPVMTL